MYIFGLLAVGFRLIHGTAKLNEHYCMIRSIILARVLSLDSRTRAINRFSRASQQPIRVLANHNGTPQDTSLYLL